jgi:hypothetical protein
MNEISWGEVAKARQGWFEVRREVAGKSVARKRRYENVVKLLI